MKSPGGLTFLGALFLFAVSVIFPIIADSRFITPWLVLPNLQPVAKLSVGASTILAVISLVGRSKGPSFLRPISWWAIALGLGFLLPQGVWAVMNLWQTRHSGLMMVATDIFDCLYTAIFALLAASITFWIAERPKRTS